MCVCVCVCVLGVPNFGLPMLSYLFIHHSKKGEGKTKEENGREGNKKEEKAKEGRCKD